MNELDAIQQQMAALGIDVSPQQQAQAPIEGETLTAEDEAMFAPGGQLAIEEAVEGTPTEGELPEMPAYDIEELKIDIQPMLQ